MATVNRWSLPDNIHVVFLQTPLSPRRRRPLRVSAMCCSCCLVTGVSGAYICPPAVRTQHYQKHSTHYMMSSTSEASLWFIVSGTQDASSRNIGKRCDYSNKRRRLAVAGTGCLSVLARSPCLVSVLPAIPRRIRVSNTCMQAGEVASFRLPEYGK